MCTFKGIIPELPSVSIDRFETNDNFDNLLSTCFFLSHCHLDHMKGIKTNLVNLLKSNSNYCLYCSPISCLILKNMDIGLEENQIKELTGMTLIEVPGNESSKTVSYYLTVTSIPAGHCPGSVMFLFETSREVILYTGDFRIIKGDISKFNQLQNYSGQNKVIDKVYFDATFMHEDYWEFPTRSESIKDAVLLIKNIFKKNPEGKVKLSAPSKFGYEYLLIELAKEFCCKIYVDNDYFDLFSNVPDIGRVLTINACATQIYFQYGRQHTKDSSVFTIRFTAKRFKWKKESLKPETLIKESGCFYRLCYATHSSCSEIIDFLQYLQPKSAEPITDSFGFDEEEQKYYIHKILKKHPITRGLKNNCLFDHL